MKMLEFYSERITVSGKSRICEMCGGEIGIGDIYCRIEYTDDEEENGKVIDMAALHADCRRVLDEYSLTGEDAWSSSAIEKWWKSYKCPNCINYHPMCNPDGECTRGYYFCPWETMDNNRCTKHNPCADMTRGCWCDKYKPRIIKHICQNERDNAHE